MSTSTLSCPFCEFTNNHIVNRLIETARDVHKEFAVQCNNCGATGPYELTIVYAVKMWNLRRGSKLSAIVESWNMYQATMDCSSEENKSHWTSFLEAMAAAQHSVQPTAFDAEIDAATDEIIRRGEDELKRRGG